MSRPRYPSDDARLATRPHVKVALDIANHPRTAAVWADVRKRGMLVELLRIAAASWAGRRGGAVVLTTPNLASIMGQQHSSNRSSVSALCSELGWTAEWTGFGLVVTVDNFSENQGFNSAARGVTPRTPSASDSDSEADTELREEPPVVPLAGDRAGSGELFDTDRLVKPAPHAPGSAQPDRRGTPAPESRGTAAPDRPGERAAPQRSGRPRPAGGRRPAPQALTDDELGKLEAWAQIEEPWSVRELSELIASCLDWHGGKGNHHADWTRTVKNWIRKERKIREEKHVNGVPRNPGIRPGPLATAIRNIAARNERLYGPR